MTTDLLAAPTLHPRLLHPFRVLAGLLAVPALAGSGLGLFAFLASGGPSAILLPPSLLVAGLALVLGIAAVRGHDPLVTYRPKGVYLSLVWAAAMGDASAQAAAQAMHGAVALATPDQPTPSAATRAAVRKHLVARIGQLAGAVQAINGCVPTRTFDPRNQARAMAVLQQFHSHACDDLAAFDRQDRP